MANFKRKGPKSTRSGCLMCKPRKRQGTPHNDRQTIGTTKKMIVANERASEALHNRA